MGKSRYAWVVDIDHIMDGEDAGVTGPRNAPSLLIGMLTHGAGQTWRARDDDGNLYYTGRIVGQYDGDAPLRDFAMPNAGATSIRIGPPAEVVEVHAAFVKNGEARFGPNHLGPSYAPVCRIRQERDASNQPNGKWLVLPNYENDIPGLVYVNGEWFYRYGYKADEPLAGGKAEALAHVSCYFTG